MSKNYRLFELEFAQANELTSFETSLHHKISAMSDINQKFTELNDLLNNSVNELNATLASRVSERWESNSADYQPTLTTKELQEMKQYIASKSPTAIYEFLNYLSTKAAQIDIKEKQEAAKFSMVPSNFKLNTELAELITTGSTEFQLNPDNIMDLHDYAFVRALGKTTRSVSFKFLTSKNHMQTCYQNGMSEEINSFIEPGKIYLVHNIKQGRKNYWNAAVLCDKFTEVEMYRVAMKLAKVFATINSNNT